MPHCPDDNEIENQKIFKAKTDTSASQQAPHQKHRDPTPDQLADLMEMVESLHKLGKDQFKGFSEKDAKATEQKEIPMGPPTVSDAEPNAALQAVKATAFPAPEAEKDSVDNDDVKAAIKMGIGGGM